MLPKMRYRLALDLGSTSIGWALIRLDKENSPCAIIRLGVRIFPDGRNPKDGTSLAVTRRAARQMRRRRDRLLKRKQRLLDALVKLNFFPQDATERKALAVLDPYVLRAKGLSEPLTAEEFARALFHINQRRGFLSNRKTDKKDNDSGALKKAISELRLKLEAEQCQTLGAWLAKRHASGDSVRARLRGKTQKEKAYDFYADRAMIEHEFDSLWAAQQKFNPSLFTNEAGSELKDILLFQRKLRPVKPGRCTLLPEEERAPLAMPSTQRFRIYQEVNNLRILQQDLREQSLAKDQRDKLVSLLENAREVRFSAMLKALKLPGHTQFNLQDIKRDRLRGNDTSATLSKPDLFGDRWHDLPADKQDAIVDRLLNEGSESALIRWLEEQTGIDEGRATRIAQSGLPEGYGNVSMAALDLILPELIGDVIPYSEAVKRAGLASHSALSVGESKDFKPFDQLPYYGDPLRRHVAFAKDNPSNDEERFGKIANPTVHIGLNELRKVVNALIKRYGHPSEVVIEVARELKMSHARSLELQREQREKQDRNEAFIQEACEILGLTPQNIDRAKRRVLSQRMQLWIELNKSDVADRRCPYTGEQISIHRLLSDEVEIEHILPYSMTLDDSLNNKTVAMRRANRDKGNMTPFDAFGKHPVAGYDYEEILQRAAKMPKEKAKRFAADGYARWLKEDKDFLARALNDTAYLSRIAKEYLSLICPPNKVRAIPGRMTAMMRGKFGLNQLLSGNELKNRNDHRHHALDAAVIGITDQGLLQRFATANARAQAQQLDRLVDELPLPWSTYREHVERALKAVVVSHKPDHGYQGAMHEETAWGLREDGKVSRLVTPEGGGQRTRQTKPLNVIQIASTNDTDRHGTTAVGLPAPYKGYVGGSNFCLEIWKDAKGKVGGAVISTFEAYQLMRELDEEAGLRKLMNPHHARNGLSLLARLINNDMVKLELDGETRLMRVVKIKGSSQFYLCEHTEANSDARDRDTSDPYAYDSKMPGSFIKAKGRRVTVSPIGDVRDPGFKA
jgi:CRISPR-associated endonuclease Csn1